MPLITFKLVAESVNTQNNNCYPRMPPDLSSRALDKNEEKDLCPPPLQERISYSDFVVIDSPGQYVQRFATSK